eukprot:gene1525-1781_t
MYMTHVLDNDQVERYGRQLITPGIGVEGQSRLVKGSVLVVGAGGLGCPVAMYLAASGVGRIGIVDYDEVEKSNLHRQIAHKESSCGQPKAESLAASMRELNSDIIVEPHVTTFTSETAMDLVLQYDIVVDASDNVATRYLANDACILASRPLISGSALKWEGQVTVYGYGENCPCYRCLFPQPPPQSAVTKCSDGGVLGPIVGVIGSLQALEAIKVLAGFEVTNVLSSRLLIYDGRTCSFRTVRIRGRQADCAVCGDNRTIDKLIDYTQFCQSPYSDKGGLKGWSQSVDPKFPVY